MSARPPLGERGLTGFLLLAVVMVTVAGGLVAAEACLRWAMWGGGQ